jgi:hypothetical protein
MAGSQIASNPTQVAASGGLNIEVPSHRLEKMTSPQIQLKTITATSQKKTETPKQKLIPAIQRLLKR